MKSAVGALMVMAMLLDYSIAEANSLVSRSACPPNPLTNYDEYVKAAHADYVEESSLAKQEGFTMPPLTQSNPKLLSRDEFAARLRYDGFECQRLVYLSDGLRVVAYHWKPIDTSGAKRPLIIFARGGSRDFGKVGPWTQWGFYNFLKAGYTVIAPQYRGNDGGEGQEEFGGAEVRDLLNVLPLAGQLEYVDTRNTFLFGRSRGGMMVALALKAGMPVRAAAIDAPLTNLLVEAQRRPLLVERNWSVLIPNFKTNAQQVMRDRSVVFWADRINAPLLILQGGDDWRASPGETLKLASELQKHNKKFELHYYAYADHMLLNHRGEADAEVVDWFNAHEVEAMR